jgi:hypothetical protein
MAEGAQRRNLVLCVSYDAFASRSSIIHREDTKIAKTAPRVSAAPHKYRISFFILERRFGVSPGAVCRKYKKERKSSGVIPRRNDAVLRDLRVFAVKIRERRVAMNVEAW